MPGSPADRRRRRFPAASLVAPFPIASFPTALAMTLAAWGTPAFAASPPTGTTTAHDSAPGAAAAASPPCDIYAARAAYMPRAARRA